MLTCSVLRCTNPGFVFVDGAQNIACCPEAYVCAEHKALIDAGASWDMEGRHVLMGQDLAPNLADWSARRSVGSAGFTLTLEIVGQMKPVEVFVRPAQARALSNLISAGNGD
ncbi:hypothetical protein ACFVYC_10755 [Pseudarthrobacter sp. NPDC058329]|uniref:hypothetical protein n=1 Tax=Pseudarthrobacter sp. NPDC058329 TaxID=3346448 RepID=UPI0036DEBA8C